MWRARATVRCFSQRKAVASGSKAALSKISFTENLPLNEYFGCIDEHYSLRAQIQANISTIEQRAHQLRIIEKRLLARLKDKNPAPLQQIPSLLDDATQSITQLATNIEEDREKLKILSNNLACATKLMLLLMRYKLELEDE
eukprot:304009_1